MKSGSTISEGPLGKKERSLNRNQARVWKCIKQEGRDGATDKEIQRALNMPGDSQRPRRRELERLGLIRESKFFRQGQRVWVAVEAAVNRPTLWPAAGQVSARPSTKQQIEADRAELDRLNGRWGHQLDTMTHEELTELIATIADVSGRDSLQRRLEKLGLRNTFVRRPLLRLLSSTRTD